MTPVFEEQAVTFDCEGETLVGVIARPRQPARRGVLIIVGGPQYRAGSHRQFVLLARHLAEQGIPSMRFDYRGMGDSTGVLRTFEQIDVDIRAAVDRFCEVTGAEEMVLWGLCDGASASIFYAQKDSRVIGMVLLNPWVRTQAGEAKAYLKHYYLSRLIDRGFWRKLMSGRLSLTNALAGVTDNIRRAQGDPHKSKREGRSSGGHSDDADSLPVRMASSLAKFRGVVLLILSGNDLTAKEFSDAVSGSEQWRGLLTATHVSRVELKAANHTFSSRAWRDQVSEHTCSWVVSL